MADEAVKTAQQEQDEIAAAFAERGVDVESPVGLMLVNCAMGTREAHHEIRRLRESVERLWDMVMPREADIP